MYSIIVLIAGMLQSAMGSFNSMLSESIGLFGVSLVVHLSGGILLILFITLILKKKIDITGMPWYLYSAGFFGVVIVSVTSFCITHLGAAVSTCFSVTGQLLISTVIDHFGLFHMPKAKFQMKRIPAFLLILVGIIILNLA